MAAAGYRWEETKPGVEHFLPEIHLQSNGWNGPGTKYSYIPDSQVFGSETEYGLPRCHLRVKSLIHATTPEAAANIIREDGLKTTNKKLLKGKRGLYLIWWGISLETKGIEKYTEECRTFTRKAMRGRDLTDQSAVDETESDSGSDDSHGSLEGLIALFKEISTVEPDLTVESDIAQRMNSFCSSAPFASTSRYGNIVFEYSIEELLREYSSQFCDGEDPIFRVMGTFAYKQEVMHAILVSYTGEFKTLKFSPLSEETSIIYKTDGDWIWSPEITGDRMIGSPTHKSYRRWEHATFAFLVPKGQVFELENLDMHMSYCAPADAAVFRTHAHWKDRERWSVDRTLKFLHKNNIIQPIQLLSIIHKHLIKILQKSWEDTIPCEEGLTRCQKCTDIFVKIDPHFLQTLLGGSTKKSTKKCYCPHELYRNVRNQATCTQRWKLWIREMTHYLLRE